MPTFQRDELFHRPGPQDALDYLWGRLQDRDLTPDEALALLSAVHHDLGKSRAEPKLYFAYSRFMEALGREMPIVHDFVVARWIESRRKGRRQQKSTPVPERGGKAAVQEEGQPDEANEGPEKDQS